MFKEKTIKAKLQLAFLATAIITVLTGILALVFTVSIGNAGKEVGEELAPLSDAAMEIKLTATTAHLIFEEIMGGDESEDIKTVWELLNESVWYCNAILNGGENDEGKFVASADPKVLAKIQDVKISINNFKKAAEQRYTSRSNSGIGSAADSEFDTNYDEILNSLGLLIEDAQNKNATAKLYHLMESKFLLADGHLFFEELMSGDKSVNYKKIIRQFKKAKTEAEQAGVLTAETAELYDDFMLATEKRYNTTTSVQTVGGQADAKFDEDFETFLTLTDEAETLIHNDMDKGLASLKSQNIVSILVMIMISATAIFVAFFIARLVVKDIVNTLGGTMKEIVHVVKRVSEGDLTVSFNNAASFGLMRDIENMVQRLKGIISEVVGGANSIASASNQISASAERVTTGATEQAASSEEISASMEEMNASIDQNTDNARQTEQIAKKAATSMQAVSEAVNNTVESMRLIAEKISIINEIAEKTDMLAVNAAIEAARAGDKGKGFAVVAGEVRMLAERSQHAAKEIGEISVNSVLVAEKSSILLKEVIPDIKKTSQLVQEIALSSVEQNSGSSQINNAIQQLTAVTQNNASTAEEMSAATQSLLHQSNTLKDAVSYFIIDRIDFKINVKSADKSVSQRHQSTAPPEVKAVSNQNGVEIKLEENSNDSEFEKFI